MSSLAIRKALLMAGGAATNIAELFATSLYTGTGAAQTIDNGIDLAGEGGLVWVKGRSGAGALNNNLADTVRGAAKQLSTNSAEPTLDATVTIPYSGINGFTSSGFTLGNNYNSENYNGNLYASWTFRRAPKFFDVVTYTGDGAYYRAIPHTLENVPGFVIVKRLDTANEFYVWHRSVYPGPKSVLYLNRDYAAASGNDYFGDITDTYFRVSTLSGVNASGGTYVAYLFAHDTSEAGLIQQVSFNTNGSGAGSYAHGWAEGVQFAMLKCTTTTGDWEMFDTARSPSWTTDLRLRANLSNAEDTVTHLSDSGGTVSFTNLSASQTYIASLIRAPS